MEADFKTIVITPENIVTDEASRIAMMLQSGAVWRVHIRHPRAQIDDVDGVLSQLPKQLYNRIALHDFYELSDKYSGVGVHLNARNIGVSIPKNVLVSKSCHSVAEVCQSQCDYVTLSPIFDSISKIGYRSAFDLNDERLHASLIAKPVFALGGVKPEYFKQLKSAGFAGAAMLGYVWCEDKNEFENRIKTISKYAAIHN